MDNLDALGESQEPQGNEAGDSEREAALPLPDDGLHGTPDAVRDIMPDMHSLRDLSISGEAGLLPVPSGPLCVEKPDAVALEPGREFMIGRKIFTLQRSLCDNTWDVEIQNEGWISTGYPKDYTAGMAEARFRNDFKGGAKKWIANRIRDTYRG